MSFIPEPSTLLGLEICRNIYPNSTAMIGGARLPFYCNKILPPNLTKLCSLNASSTVDDNLYHVAASALAQFLDFDDKLLTIMDFLQFINFMRQEYKRLLELKDSRSLLPLAYWYAKVCQTQQSWLWHRAALDGQAICIHLGRSHRHDADIQDLLQFPSTNCSNSAL